MSRAAALLTGDMEAKWAALSAAFIALNASRPAQLSGECLSCTPSRTVNGDGQHIQAHFGPKFGWRSVSGPYPCRCSALAVMHLMPAPCCDLMVYEALKVKS